MFHISDFIFRISDFRFQIPDFRFQISNFRFRISYFRFQISDFRFQISGSNFQFSDFRFQISDSRYRISDFRCQISDFGFPISDFQLATKQYILVSNNLVEQLVSDAGGEMQPNKRCKHDGMMVSSKDFTIPENLQPITAALAEEINKFKVECEQWDPPNFGEDATISKFLMTEVYKRLRSSRVRECLPAYTAAQIRPIYAVIKALLALLHSDVQSSRVASSLLGGACALPAL